jgi:hypothetical protein
VSSSRPPARALRRSLGLAVALLIAVPAVAAAKDNFQAGSETATAGTVTATLSWSAGEFAISSPRLAITRAGAPAFDAALPKDVCDECVVSKAYPGAESADDPAPDLQVVDLDGNGEPEVIVAGFTGGAHCCTIAGIYGFDAATGTYGHITRNFLDAGYVLRDLDGDGKPELQSSDARFAYAFASFAASFFPPQIFRYELAASGPRLRNVTKSFPTRIRSNAKEALHLFHRTSDPGKTCVDCGGALAAYVADQYLLGRGASTGLGLVATARRQGILGSDKAAAKFRKRLLGFLHELGYR